MLRHTYAIRADMARVEQEMTKLTELFGDDLKNAPDGQRAHFDRLCTQSKKLVAEFDESQEFEATRAQRIDVVRTAAQSPVNRIAGTPLNDAPTAGDLVGRNGSNPWANRSEPVFETANELRSRALDAIELVPAADDETRERMTRLIEHPRYGKEAAEYLLAVSDPQYKRAFFGYLTRPQDAHLTWDEGQREAFSRVQASRAAMSLTSANGGYMLPFELDPTIILSNAGTQNEIRQVARVVQTTQNVWHGVTSAGVTAEWTAEAAEAADASPTVAQPTVTCFKGDAWIQASYEFLQDSNIESDIASLVADAKARLEATAFINGNGTSQPHGLVTVLSGVTASRVSTTTNGAFGLPDIYALDNNLSPRWRPNASWLANKSIYNLVRQMGTSAWNTFWADQGSGNPSQLIGYNTYQASDMTSSLSAATASTDNILVLGDFRNYLIADRIGMSIVL